MVVCCNLSRVSWIDCFWVILFISFFTLILYLRNWIFILLCRKITGRRIYDHPSVFYLTPFIKTNILELKKLTRRMVKEDISLFSRRITKVYALQGLGAKLWPLVLGNEGMSSTTKNLKIYYREFIASISLIEYDILLYSMDRYPIEYISGIVDSIWLEAF